MIHRKLSTLSRVNMEIIDFQYRELDDWWKATNLSSPFTRVYMVTKGVGYLHYHNVDITMTPGNIYVIPAGLRFSYSCENGFCKSFFHILVPLPNGYDLFENSNEIFCFSDEKIVNRTAEILYSDSIKDIMQIRADLYSIICRCLESAEQKTPGQLSDHVVKATEYIEENLSSSLTLDKIAGALLISPERLRKTFRAEIGVPIGKYINNRLMYKAELEIRRGEFTVKEISEKLGFYDQFYFSRCFTEKYGLSPTKYRKKVGMNQ